MPERSLSMVFGMPTTFSPLSKSFFATPSVSSPPIATTAWMLFCSSVRKTASTPPSRLNGFVREVPRMVPPRWRMPETDCRFSRKWFPSMSPRHPSRMPTNSKPWLSPRRTTARMTAFRPGQSPPPVRIATFISTGPPRYAPPGDRPRPRPRARTFERTRRVAAAEVRDMSPPARRPGEAARGVRGDPDRAPGDGGTDSRAARRATRCSSRAGSSPRVTRPTGASSARWTRG